MKKSRRLQPSDVWWGLAAATLILLQFWWLPGEDGSIADSYSTTIDGKLGLYRVLSQLFPDVSRDAINVAPASDATLLLIAPDRYPNSDEQQKLYEFVYDGGCLLFAPRWQRSTFVTSDVSTNVVKIPALGIDLTQRPFFSRNGMPRGATQAPALAPGASNQSPAEAETQSAPAQESPAEGEIMAGVEDGVPQEAMNSATPDEVTSESAEEVVVDSVVDSSVQSPGGDSDPSGEEVHATTSLVADAVVFRSMATLNLPPHLTTETLVASGDGSPEVATWRMGAGRVVVCTSPDFFSNRSLLNRNSRRLAVRLVELCAKSSEEEADERSAKIVINEYFNASDSYRETGILFSPGLRTGTLQLLLVAVLSVWMAFHRFGPAAEVTTLQRRSLTESAQAVGNLQYNLHDRGSVIRGYLEYISSQLRRRYGSLLRLSDAEFIAGRCGLSADEVRHRLSEAQKMADSERLSAPEAASMLRWLARLQQRLTGNRNVD